MDGQQELKWWGVKKLQHYTKIQTLHNTSSGHLLASSLHVLLCCFFFFLIFPLLPQNLFLEDRVRKKHTNKKGLPLMMKKLTKKLITLFI